MNISLRELACLVDGKLSGEGNIVISGAATIRDAGPGEITLADHPKLAARLASSRAAAVVVPAAFEPPGLPFVTVENVHAAFARIVAHFHPPRAARRVGVSPAAHVSPTARLGAGVDIHPGAVIGDDVEIGAGSTIHAGCTIQAGCKLGENVTLFPHVVLYENTILGDRVIIHACAVIGCYGFGYDVVEGRHRRGSQLGHVEIGADVEIGAATTIDRGTYGPTVIGEGTKIDNQVMIAHNCRIGRHNLICSQVGIAGSSSTGDYVVMAGQVGIKDHVHIGEGTTLCAQCGVMNDIPPGVTYVGSPAIPVREKMQLLAHQNKLPEMRKTLKALEQQVAALARLVELRAHPEAA
jgi:UDP-3-O-[3-hydroxymyristoyl] glucosamine N-acyltransferase